jgi:hypothetical protein
LALNLEYWSWAGLQVSSQRHLNLLGEYDFSAEKLRDSVGIRLPKLGAKKEVFLDLIQTHKPQCTERIR